MRYGYHGQEGYIFRYAIDPNAYQYVEAQIISIHNYSRIELAKL
jgi:hypothetical protein